MLDARCRMHICYVHECYMLNIEYLLHYCTSRKQYIPKRIAHEWKFSKPIHLFHISYIVCTGARCTLYVYTGVVWQLFFVHIHIIMATMATAPTLIFNKQQCLCIRYIYLIYLIFHVIVDFRGCGDAWMRECTLQIKFVWHIIYIYCCGAFNDAWNKCSKTRTSIAGLLFLGNGYTVHMCIGV